MKNISNLKGEVSISSYIVNSSLNEETIINSTCNLNEENTICIKVSGLDSYSNMKVNNAYIYCLFNNILDSNTTLKLTDANGETIDLVVVGDQNQEYFYTTENVSSVIFDITKALKNYSGEGDLVFQLSNLTPIKTVEFIGYNYLDMQNESILDKIEYFQFNYDDYKGNSDKYLFLEQNFGINGIGKVNVHNGNFIYILPLCITRSFSSSLAYSLIHNSANISYTNSALYSLWEKSLYYDILRENEEKIIWKDMFGQEKEFVLLLSEEKEELNIAYEENVYYCFESNEYIVDLGENQCIFIDKTNQKMYFDCSNGYTIISKIVDSQSNSYNFVYNEGFLSKIVAFDGNEIIFTYYGAHIDQIYISNEDVYVKIVRSGDYLGIDDYRRVYSYRKKKDITNPDGNNVIEEILSDVSFSYYDAKIVSVFDNLEKRGYRYVYEDDRVSSITEIKIENATDLQGYSYELEYFDGFTIVTHKNGYKQMFYFDRHGSCTHIVDSNNITQNFRYAHINKFDENRNCHNIISSIKTQTNLENYIFNNSFDFLDSETDGWEVTKEENTKLSKSNESMFGNKSLKITKTDITPFVLRQKVKLVKAGNYKLFGFYKFINGSNSVVKIKVIAKYNKGVYENNNYILVPQEDMYETLLTHINGHWNKFEIFSIPVEKNAEISISIETESENFELIVDEFQLNRNNTLFNHNLVKNSHFERVTNGRVDSWVEQEVDELDGVVESVLPDNSNMQEEFLGKYVYKFSKNSNGRKKIISQKILVSGNSGDHLIINAWFKSFVTYNETLKIEIQVHDPILDKIETYDYHATKNMGTWQTMVNSLITETKYDFIKIRIIYYGCHDVLIGAVQMYKSSLGTMYSYDNRGNLLKIVNDYSTESGQYNSSNKLTKKTFKDGTIYKYYYDEEGKLIKICDNFNNEVTFAFSEENNQMKKTILTDGKIIEIIENTTDTGVKEITDEFGEKTIEVYDGHGNVIFQKNSENVIVGKKYDKLYRVEEINRMTDNCLLSTVSFEYNENKKQIKKILCSNDTEYSFEYDSWGRCTKVLVNGEPISTKSYSERGYYPKDLLMTENYSNSATEDRIYVYDDNGRLIEIKNSIRTLVNIRYDNFGKVFSIYDCISNITHYFDYDLSGKIVREYFTTGEQNFYEYDNLGNIQKEIFTSLYNHISKEYHYDYEINKLVFDFYVDFIDETYQDDIVYPEESNDGRYGLKLIEDFSQEFIDGNLHKKVLMLSRAGDCVCYDFRAANTQRPNETDSKKVFYKKLWDLRLVNNKSIFGWFRFDGIAENYNCLTLLGEEGSVSVEIVSNYRIKIKANNGISETYDYIDFDRDLSGEWLMLGIEAFTTTLSSNNKVVSTICLCVNGKKSYGLKINPNIVPQLTTIVLGDTKILEGQNAHVSENALSLKVAMLSAGSYKYSDENLAAIYEKGKKYFIFSPEFSSNSSVSVTYLSDSYDYISLDGTVGSYKKLYPLSVAYHYGKEEMVKNSAFVYDAELGRYVYCSFGNENSLQDSKTSELSYHLFLDSNFALAMKIKLSSIETTNDRTLFSLSDGNYSDVFSLFVDLNNKLSYSICGQEFTTDIYVSEEEWHNCSISKGENELVILFDNQSIISGNEFILNSEYLNIGHTFVMVNNKGKAINQLNGYVRDIMLANEYLTTVELGSIYDKLNKYIIERKKDALGRLISSSIKHKEGSYLKNYDYLQPKDEEGNIEGGKTSLLISKTVDSLGETVEYGYTHKKITSIKKIKGENVLQTEYEYDRFERLICSVVDGKKTEYSYDLNGNIIKKKITTGNVITEINCSYAECNQERIIKVQRVQNNELLEVIDYLYNEEELKPYKIGNKELTWTGDLLTNISIDGETLVSNSFDCTNRRVSKSGVNSTILFTYGRDGLLSERTINYEIVYTRGPNKEIEGFVYTANGTSKTYFYLKDINGVIDNVMDEDGNIVCAYKYDDYGVLLEASGDQTIININHIIYKCYYYDFELGWYLLGKRYYNPEIGRFISPDDYDNLFSVDFNLNHYNIYSYCDCNPILRRDISGCSWLSEVLGAIAGVLLGVPGFIIGGVVGLADGIAKGEPFLDVLKSTLDGAVDGFKLGWYTGKEGVNVLFGITETEEYKNGLKERANSFVMTYTVGIMFLGDVFLFLLPTLLGGIGVVGILINEVYLQLKNINSLQNYVHNSEIEDELIEETITHTNGIITTESPYNVIIDGKVYITGQSVEENYVLKYENYKFGFTDINYAGCEIMAVYNMSVLLGLNWKMADLIYYFESKNLCFGFLGAFVTHLKQLLLMANINFDECYDVEELNTIFSNPKYKCYILTYWNDVQDLMGMLHTTFVNIINRYVSKNQKLYLLTDEEIELEGDLTIERKSANEKLYEVNGRDVPKINFDEILNKQLDGSYSKWLVSAFLIY